MSEELYKALEVVEMSTGKVVKVVKLDPPKNERQMLKVMRGMLINLGDGYCVRDVGVKS